MAKLSSNDVIYVAVLLKNSKPFNALVPDLGIFATDNTKDGVMTSLKNLAEEAIVSSVNGKLPIQTPLNILKSKWDGDGAEFLNLTIHI